MLRNVVAKFEESHQGLRAALPEADLGLLAAGAIVFGLQKLVPAYEESYKVWYPKLRKPSWNPPNWIFPAVWIPLKILQSAALWLVWKSAGSDKASVAVPLTIFGVHALLGNQWNVVFFGRHDMPGSLKWMGAFWLSVAATAYSFYSVDPLAGLLIAPTQVWVSVAAKLNYDIVRLNKDDEKRT
ncbi:g1938 [Coccomyxa elongata]